MRVITLVSVTQEYWVADFFICITNLGKALRKDLINAMMDLSKIEKNRTDLVN
ncbi:hypothetical protein H5S40_00840 [Limosilactobacillus sp. RRLNB_1_1]|uniref:Uncharacterized protein n=1 Tax=Limosilactobacillus albertensis TaxID=2759752 RepID=A0A7W3Y7V4_9LACO|nr:MULTISPECIES: hypothetical protein [Limosilactobacillus]MBB1068743.1 hypothetical protein [Limosilactobacillus albertensis]MBB1123933.1 hypothetical protein [Limosilactobacillus albertensis]MCD7118312.1 hypothetical protein [Limosilactobacillus albertensis]MCD7121694.1 hypothetical protein [Limosilactobacillus albertensis]MCD7125353.1 hypothetical protein [Limosilactobacillus caviae]